MDGSKIFQIQKLKIKNKTFSSYKLSPTQQTTSKQISVSSIENRKPSDLKRGKGRRKWTRYEDIRLFNLVEAYGQEWAKISNQFPDHSTKDIKERYNNTLNPNIRKSIFTEEEDLTLLKLVNEHGKDWKRVHKYIKGRSIQMLKNRYHSKLKFLNNRDLRNSLLPSKFLGNKRKEGSLEQPLKEMKTICGEVNDMVYIKNLHLQKFQTPLSQRDVDCSWEMDIGMYEEKEPLFNLQEEDSDQDLHYLFAGVAKNDFSFPLNSPGVCLAELIQSVNSRIANLKDTIKSNLCKLKYCVELNQPHSCFSLGEQHLSINERRDLLSKTGKIIVSFVEEIEYEISIHLDRYICKHEHLFHSVLNILAKLKSLVPLKSNV